MSNINQINHPKLVVGHSIHDSMVIRESDVLNFAELVGDFNPLHVDEYAASKSIFKKRVVHGMFVASLFSRLFGDQKFGISGIYLSQNLKFLKPVYINDLVDIHVELININKVRSIYNFRTSCMVFDRLVVDGSAEVFID